MFKPKVTREEFEKELAVLEFQGESRKGRMAFLEKKLDALYNHLGLEYFEEETSGVREKKDWGELASAGTSTEYRFVNNFTTGAPQYVSNDSLLSDTELKYTEGIERAVSKKRSKKKKTK